jgi:hypothetical protein
MSMKFKGDKNKDVINWSNWRDRSNLGKATILQIEGYV